MLVYFQFECIEEMLSVKSVDSGESKLSKVPKSRSEKDKTRFGGAVKRVRYCFAAIFRAIWKGFSHNVTATDDEDMLVLYSLAQITQL